MGRERVLELWGGYEMQWGVSNDRASRDSARALS